MRFLLLILTLLFSSLCALGNSHHTLDIWDNKDYSPIKPTQTWLKGIQSFRLDRNCADRDFNLAYLVATDKHNATFIFATIEDGFAFKYKVFDINQDGKTELLVFFGSGGNANILKIFSIADDKKRTYTPKDLKEWNTTHIVSNCFGLDAIKVEKGKIKIVTRDYSDGGVLEITYKVSGNSVVEQKSIKIR